MVSWGLRSKSLFALIITCILALMFAAIMSWALLKEGKIYSAKNYAKSFTELNYQKILTPISRELALAERFAGTSTVKEWMEDPSNITKQAAFTEDVEGFLSSFQDHSLFFVTDATKDYYFSDENNPFSMTPKYRLSHSAPRDDWYFQTRQQPSLFNINVDEDEHLKLTKIWINYIVKNHGVFVGLVGTGFSLDHFLDKFTTAPVAGVQPFIINADGGIEAHQDKNLIAFDTLDGNYGARSIFALLDNDESKQSVKQAMLKAKKGGEKVISVMVEQNGSTQLMSFMYFPLLNWFVVTNVNLNDVNLINMNMLLPAVGIFVFVLVLLITVFGFAVERLVIAPVRRLQLSAKAIESGSYNVTLPVVGNDEIGELSKTFNNMAAQVRNHTEDLERKVKERTAELEETHQEVADAHRKIGASIDYASLIQKAILPDRQMKQFLGDHHSIVWRPRDVVGGDFYVFQNTDEGCLLGIVDCAGHGVPGALMTMLLRAAIDHATMEVGIQDPAALLRSIDSTLRSMLNEDVSGDRVATNADVGLVYISKDNQTMRFAGAKIGLYASNGKEIIQYKPSRRALGDRRLGEYENIDLPVSGWTYYMTTDGFLDQAGGEKKFGFGNRRFESLLQDAAGLTLSAQASAFVEALNEYMGDQPQRDDITLLSFRFGKELANREG
ncbi:biofilm regulation protein phosphatase SiaA [Marinomonas flavescens]|uniref:biofilm regulation protein phosphatase SiaA n=1 Tax=Marinomonas flavescens TaxID=2529379 RepID=UPI001056B6D8|nr:biofilm regulation protein phosphatase SiaA [Marinomonas flavescens]